MNCTNCQAGQLASSDRVNFICNNCRAHYRYNPATSTIDFVGIIAAQTPTVNAGPNNFSGNNSNNDSLRSRVAAMQSNNANQPLGHDPENWPNQNDLPSFVKPKNNLKKILFIIPAILILALGGLIFYNFNYLKKHNASAIAQNFSSDLEKINSKIDFKVTMSGDNVGTVKVFPATLNFNSLNDTSGNSSINTVLDMVDAKIDLSFLLRDNYAKVYGKINNLEVGSNLADQYPDISTQLDDLDKSWYLLSSSNSNSSSLIPELVTGCEEKGNIVKFISSLSKDDLGAIKYSVKSPKLFISDLKYEIKASGNLKQFLSVLKSINSKAPSECQIATEDLDRLESESAAILEKITADFSVVLTKTNFKFDLNLTGLENIYQQNTSSRATDNDSCDLLSESNTAADIIEDCSESSSSTDNLFEEYAKLKTINFSSEIVLDNNISVEAEPKDYQTLDELLNSFTQPKVEDFNELKVEDLISGTGTSAELGKKIKVRYVGKLSDGTVFDSTNKDASGKAIDGIGGDPIEFVLSEGGLIKGWTDGIPGMKVGGQRKLTIPSSLGYGAGGTGTIPANAGLIFDVELVDVQNAN